MTEIIRSRNDISNLLNKKYNIHFIPTMGSLHEGHLKMVKNAKSSEDSKTLVSIFVNPIQFSEKLDFTSYPKNKKTDIKKLKSLKVDFIFVPNKNFIDESIFRLRVSSLSNMLCGFDRKDHFDGVATVILKFLIIFRPNFIYLGEKDFQQILVIKKLINDFAINTRVKTFATVREDNGLALSSRNKNLTISQRKSAEKIILILKQFKKKIDQRIIDVSELYDMEKQLLKFGLTKVNYLEIRKEKNLNFVDKEFCLCRLFVSVTVGQTRLIDNIKLGKVKIFENKIIKQLI